MIYCIYNAVTNALLGVSDKPHEAEEGQAVPAAEAGEAASAEPHLGWVQGDRLGEGPLRRWSIKR